MERNAKIQTKRVTGYRGGKAECAVAAARGNYAESVVSAKVWSPLEFGRASLPAGFVPLIPIFCVPMATSFPSAWLSLSNFFVLSPAPVPLP